ncbi:hypothetical protein [Faecalibacter sp. LW9]|uniref:hypothetical protein n=1 Tax=Faecalibacter sp. LW9 TaxID=3103144 RepID=UPI002AFEEA51|nr:hypothetical protein [Faecalibacter sp. LW9]
MNKIFNTFSYLLKRKTPVFKTYDNTIPSFRRLQSNDITSYNKEVILTTYFTTKKDPQRSTFTENDDFNYIKEFYESIIKQNLHAIIFYDSLSNEFITKYSCKNIQFIKVNLGPYSLNDERFYIYCEYITLTKPEKIIMAEVNDVIFLKHDVFDFISSNKLYICKDESFLMYKNSWMLNKIDNLPFDINKLNYSFWEMPIVNAGVIGGDYTCIKYFLECLISLFERIDNDKNNNMIVVNIVFHDIFWVKYCNTLNYKIHHLLDKNWTNILINKKEISKENFHIGFPFTTQFKKEEITSLAYIKHK